MFNLLLLSVWQIFFIPTFPEEISVLNVFQIKSSHLWPFIPHSCLSFVDLLFSKQTTVEALWSSGYINCGKCLAVREIFLFYFVKSNFLQNRIGLPLLFSTCYRAKSTSKRNTVFACFRFALFCFTIYDTVFRLFLLGLILRLTNY